eukprot:10173885-Alexandrium_andersonii.AAC.1
MCVCAHESHYHLFTSVLGSWVGPTMTNCGLNRWAAPSAQRLVYTTLADRDNPARNGIMPDCAV